MFMSTLFLLLLFIILLTEFIFFVFLIMRKILFYLILYFHFYYLNLMKNIHLLGTFSFKLPSFFIICGIGFSGDDILIFYLNIL